MRRSYNTFRYFIAVTGLYLLVSLILPGNHATQANYHLSTTQYHILLFFIVLPLLLIWVVAYYGYDQLRGYDRLIRKSPEGDDFRRISDGLMWLAWGFPAAAFLSMIVSAVANTHPGFIDTAAIINNYANMVVPVIGFTVLSTGTHSLTEREHARISSQETKLLILFFVTIGALYCYFVFRHLGAMPASSSHNPYHLPAWLLIATMVIPYLYAWFTGLLAAYEMRLLGKRAKGLLYQQALQHLARGLVVIVASSISLQYLYTVVPRDGHGVSLGYLLLLVYCILIVMAVGYALVAFGAKKLKRIEEV